MTWHDGCIASEAKCLGSKTVCSQAFEYIKEGNMNIISELVTDQQTLQAVETFLGERCTSRHCSHPYSLLCFM